MSLEDLLSRRAGAEQSLADLLLGEESRIPQSLVDQTGKIESARGRFFSDAESGESSFQSSLGLAPSSSPEIKQLVSSRLGRALSGRNARLSRSRGRERLGRKFDVAYNFAIHEGASEREARQYASQVQQQGEREALITQSDKESRESALRKEDLADKYGRLESDLESQIYEPYSSGDLLLAQLVGLGGALGAGYGVSKYMNRPKKPKPEPSSGGFGGRLSLSPYTVGASSRSPYGGELDYSSITRPSMRRFRR